MEPGRICALSPTWVGLLALAGLGTTLVCSSCSPAKDPAAGQRDSTSAPPAPILTQTLIPPNACRVHATILAIDSSFTDGSSTDPCSRFPCRATVRIDEVLGYGSAFNSPLPPGETMSVHFTLTLAPSNLVFPDMKPELPGLAVGNAFAADVEGGGPAIGGVARSYTVRTYAIKK